MTVYVYWYTYVDKVALENSLDIENDNSFVFFLFSFFGYFLFSSLSALQEGLVCLEGPYVVSTATLRKTWFDRRINFILLANGWIRQLSLKVASLKFGILYRSIVHF